MELKRDTLLQGGRYRIVDSIGRGGFGITYLAEQVMARRRVCIKEFFPKDYYKREGNTGSLTLSSEGFGETMNKFKTKFIKEAQTIAALDHPNIIHIHDVFEENSTAYYVMDYIEGESLSELVKRDGAMSERDAVAYIKQVAAALEHIHEQQIMHLDVKPGNIMVRTKDSRSILIDFGLSKHYDAESGEATSTTPVGVSHGYAPMEQYQDGGVSTFSPETDIYSLGATLYYLVTGNVPPQATAVAEQGLPQLGALSSNIRETIERSMSYLRKDRPHTIKEFLALLDNEVPVVEVLVADDERTRITPKHTTTQHDDKKPKLKKSRWWAWLVVLMAAGLGIFYGLGKSLQSAGKGFYGFYEVGDYYNRDGKEGVVFEVWDGGRHGKIVSLDETKAKWDSRVVYENGEYSNVGESGADDMNDGMVNTGIMMRPSDNKHHEAFVWCRDKGDDWYLPAKNELIIIGHNKSKINRSLEKYGTVLKDERYWSSTACTGTKGEYSALSVKMAPDYPNLDNNLKSRDLYVRAVSTF